MHLRVVAGRVAGPPDEVEVDSVVGVERDATGQVVGVLGDEGVHFIAVADEMGSSGGVMGDCFEFLGVERVAVAVMEAVFADAGVGVACIVHRAMAAEFDVFLKAALGFQFGRVRSGVGSGFSLGIDSLVGVRIIRGVVEATAEQFFGGVEAVAGFEVGEFALHYGDEEADGGAAMVGCFAHDLSEFAADAMVRAGGFGRGVGVDGARALGRDGAVDAGLGRREAEFDQEAGGVKAVAGLEVRELAVHGGGQEADDEPAVLGFLGDDVG